MAKVVFKQVMLTLLVTIAVGLFFIIVFYNVIPANKLIPSKVQEYQTPNSISAEIEEIIEEYSYGGDEYEDDCYDYDSGLYFIQNRYYNPEIGRFINVDNINSLITAKIVLDFNLFAYCGNNPITYSLKYKDKSEYLTIESNYAYNKSKSNPEKRGIRYVHARNIQTFFQTDRSLRRCLLRAGHPCGRPAAGLLFCQLLHERRRPLPVVLLHVPARRISDAGRGGF